MHRHAFVGTALLGILIAFWAWALTWSINDHKALTFGLSGDTTSFATFTAGADVTVDGAQVAQAELLSFLRAQDVTLIAASGGTGHPSIAVFDQADRLSWATDVMSNVGAQSGSVYVIRDTYSDRTWNNVHTSPLLPEGKHIVGSVPRPPGSGELQFVEAIGQEALTPGSIVSSTTDPGVVAEIQRILAKEGLAVQSVREMNGLSTLTHDSLIIAATGLYVAGLTCAAGGGFLALRARERRLSIHVRFGATRRVLAARWSVREAVPIVLGTLAGALASGSVALAVGQQIPPVAEWLVLGRAAIAGSVIAIFVWSCVVALFVATRGELTDAR